MNLSTAQLLRLYLSSSDRLEGRPLHRVVIETARRLHLAGASAFTAELALGAHGRRYDARSEYSGFDVPLVIEIVDAPERIALFLAELERLRIRRVCTVQSVQVLHYRAASETGGS